MAREIASSSSGFTFGESLRCPMDEEDGLQDAETLVSFDGASDESCKKRKITNVEESQRPSPILPESSTGDESQPIFGDALPPGGPPLGPKDFDDTFRYHWFNYANLFPFYARHHTDPPHDRFWKEDGQLKMGNPAKPVKLTASRIGWEGSMFVPHNNQDNQKAFCGDPAELPFFFWPGKALSNVADQTPRTMKGWLGRTHGRLVARLNNLERFLSVLDRGIDVYSYYSGSCAPESVMASSLDFLRNLGFQIPLDALRICHQCDWSRNCQTCMKNIDEDCKGLHQFRGIEERLPKDVSDLLNEMEPDENASPEECKEAFKLMEEVLEDVVATFPPVWA